MKKVAPRRPRPASGPVLFIATLTAHGLYTPIETEQPLGGVSLIEAALDWPDPAGKPFGVDLAALLVGSDGQVGDDADFVFYNQPASPDGAVRLRGSPESDDRASRQLLGEAMHLDLGALPSHVRSVVLAASIDADIGSAVSFAVVPRLRLRVQDASTGRLIWQVDMENPPATRGLALADCRRDGDGWALRWLGQTYETGLAGIAVAFGVDVEGDAERTQEPVGDMNAPGASTEQSETASEAVGPMPAARKRLTREGAFVADLAQRLPEDAMLARVGHHLRSVVHKCGRQRLGT